MQENSLALRVREFCLPELANDTTPIEGLYLTGAGTHPGGAISGMPGRNCACVFLQQHPVRVEIS